MRFNRASPPFSHGHSYVTTSGISNASDIAVAIHETQIINDNIVIQVLCVKSY